VSLAEFLLARIAEDEEAARAAPGPRWVCKYRQRTEPPFSIERYAIASPVEFAGQELGAQTIAFTEDDTAESKALVYHAVAWDPARVLAECEAKRRIVEMGESWCSDYAKPGTPERAEAEGIARNIGLDYTPHWPEKYAPYCDGCAAAQSADNGHARVLRLLASTYSTHPHFNPAWALP
jgi:hypothetical protein